MEPISRRDLLRLAGRGSLAALIASWFSSPSVVAETNYWLPPGPIPPQGYSYFTPTEISFLEAAVSRLIPNDELGPGAKEAGVPLFIDQQMAGPYGRAANWYMDGPWPKGTEQQGYQLRLTPAMLYRTAIHDIDGYCHGAYHKTFAQLAATDQDKVLHGLEKGDIQLAGAPAKEFFKMLWQNTMEGYLADPLYGGNRNFAGWKLVGFPGPRYDYTDYIEQYGKKFPLPTVGIWGPDASAGRKGY